MAEPLRQGFVDCGRTPASSRLKADLGAVGRKDMVKERLQRLGKSEMADTTPPGRLVSASRTALARIARDLHAEESEISSAAASSSRRLGAQGSGVAAVRAAAKERKRRRMPRRNSQLVQSKSGPLYVDCDDWRSEGRVDGGYPAKLDSKLADLRLDVTFIAAWGNIAHLHQEATSGLTKRQASVKNLTTGIRENAVAAPIS